MDDEKKIKSRAAKIIGYIIFGCVLISLIPVIVVACNTKNDSAAKAQAMNNLITYIKLMTYKEVDKLDYINLNEQKHLIVYASNNNETVQVDFDYSVTSYTTLDSIVESFNKKENFISGTYLIYNSFVLPSEMVRPVEINNLITDGYRIIKENVGFITYNDFSQDKHEYVSMIDLYKDNSKDKKIFSYHFDYDSKTSKSLISYTDLVSSYLFSYLEQ